MDYFPGLTLDLKSLPSPDALLIYMLKIAIAVEELHHFQIAHMDLKRENSICSDTGEVKLFDLGLSCRFDEAKYLKLDDCQTTRGTPYYVAPEIYLKNFSDQYKADIWAFGIFFYNMLYDKFPYDSDAQTQEEAIDEMMEEQKVPPFYNSKPGYEKVIDIIQLCIRYKMEERPTATSLVQIIRKEMV